MVTSPQAGSDAVAGQLRMLRQPIFDQTLEVVAYDLSAPTLGPTRAATVLLDGWLRLGRERLTYHRPAAVRVPGELLVGGALTGLPPDGLILRVGPEVSVNESIRAALTTLGGHGYELALDDVAGPDDPRRALFELVDLVRLDLATVDKRARDTVAEEARSAGARVLVTGVDTDDDLVAAWQLRADLAQGFFFADPDTFETKRASELGGHRLGLLEACSRPELDYDEVEQLLRQDLALAERFLRYVNAAAFGWRSSITSLRHAIVLIGPQQLRSWLSLVVMATVAEGRPRELLVTASVRASLLEALGASLGPVATSFELFATGMFSLLDAALGVPMEQALEGLALPAGAAAALRGQAHPLTDVLAAVVAWERGDADRAGAALERVGIGSDELAHRYLDAVQWADRLVYGLGS